MALTVASTLNGHTHMRQRRSERNLSDIRTLTEALNRAKYDSGRSTETLAEHLGVRRAYLSDALNEEHDELQFQARHLLTFCQQVGPLPLEWLAAQLGYVLVPLLDAQHAASLTSETLDAVASAGELASLVREASADGRITPQERDDIVAAARRGQRELAEVERAASAREVTL